MNDEEIDILDTFIKERNRGTYKLSEYFIKVYKIGKQKRFNESKIRIHTQKILKEYTTDRIHRDIKQKIMDMPI